MENKKRLIMLVIISAFSLAFISCGSNSKLAGLWVNDNDGSGLELFKNGTGKDEKGNSLTWIADKNRLMFTVGNRAFSASYSISGSTLMLTFDDGQTQILKKGSDNSNKQILAKAGEIKAETTQTLQAQQYDHEDDFKVEPVDGGKSVRITAYVGDKWAILIPPQIRQLPVTDIGQNAFRDMKITSVTIPNSITSIGDGAFANNQLTSIAIPNSVTLIGRGAFYNNQLTNITIPNSVTAICIDAFDRNPLNHIIIPDSVTFLERSWSGMEQRWIGEPFPNMTEDMFISSVTANDSGLVKAISNFIPGNYTYSNGKWTK